MLRTSSLFRYVGAPLLLAALLSACDESTVSPQEAALDELRAAVAPFEGLAAAQDAGYSVLVVHPTNGNECLRDPAQGAMGYHYLNPELADGSVAVDRPEVLIYERRPDGTYDFVAVEFIVPFAVRADSASPPVLFGREFQQNYTFNLWALHAWVGKDNPSGTFANYNPDVSCP